MRKKVERELDVEEREQLEKEVETMIICYSTYNMSLLFQQVLIEKPWLRSIGPAEKEAVKV